VEIEFDPAKDAANQAKHGIALSTGRQVIEAAMEWVADTRMDYGEERFLAFGYVDSHLYVCVFTLRGETTRIISVRRAGRREGIIYG